MKKSRRILRGRVKLRRGLRRSKSAAAASGKVIAEAGRTGYQALKKSGRATADRAAILGNTVLASSFAKDMEHWLGQMFNEGIPSVYDKAMDATYIATHIGGGKLHRLYDGSHTLWGAWDKVRDALPDDALLQEVTGYLTGLGKDLSSTVGLPLFGMTKASYDSVAGALGDTFGINRSWFADLLHVNAVELVGASIGTIAVALNWNKKQVGEFSRLAGSLGISAIASANPALAVVTLAALAKSFMEVRQKGSYREVVQGIAKGGVGTGVFLGTASIVSGPAWVGLMTGFCAGAVVHKTMGTVKISELRSFVRKSADRVLRKRRLAEGTAVISNRSISVA